MPPAAFASRRVLLVGASSMLTDALNILLTSEGDLEVSGLVNPDERAVVAAVQQVQPEVVVLVETRAADTARFYPWLHQAALEQPLRVIVVHLDNQPLDVFDRQRVTLTGSQDIVRLIHGRLA